MSHTVEAIRTGGMNGGAGGFPAPRFVFDTSSPEDSYSQLMRWAERILEMRKTCPGNVRPVCPFDVVGRGAEPMLRDLNFKLPIGVHLATRGGQYTFTPFRKDGVPLARTIAYLVAA